MHLGGVAGMPARLDVVEAAADELEGFVHRAVEQDVVIGHIEMAVVVDPAGFDPHQRGDEGGEEHGFEIATLEHGEISTLSSKVDQPSPPLEKYLGEVRLQRFGIGGLTAEADIAVGTDHIQTCTPSSI